jgi:hypothetical protein
MLNTGLSDPDIPQRTSMRQSILKQYVQTFDDIKLDLNVSYTLRMSICIIYLSEFTAC